MFRSVFFLIFFSFIFHGSSYAAEKGEIDFEKGISHFKNKNYKSALYYFNKASNAGMTTSILHFNLGVTHYKLQQYKAAEKKFRLITKDKKLQQIAFYNLGLVAEKQHKKNDAINWYNKTVSVKSNNITQLADARLDKLLNRKKTPKSKIIASINLALGYNDNIATAASGTPSNKSDNYLETFAYAHIPLAKQTKMKANFYQLKYSNISSEDFRFLSLAVEHDFLTKYWKISPELVYLKSKLNNTAYQNVIDFKINGKYTFKDKSRLGLRYRFSDINSETIRYSYLDGQRHQFRVDYKKKLKLGRLRLRYQLETNDRKNSIFRNYSPTRHTFRTRLKHKLKNNWSLSEEIGLRSSQYKSSVTGFIRNDTRLRIGFVGTKKINNNWYSGIRYSYTNNNSNIASESYIQNNVQIFADWNF